MRLNLVNALVLSALMVLACRREKPNAFFGLRLVPVDVCVVDEATSRPVIGAVVYPSCLGGTPYATNSYRTDSNGLAHITSFESLAAVRVTMTGFEEASVLFMPTNEAFTNCVVRLKKVPK